MVTISSLIRPEARHLIGIAQLYRAQRWWPAAPDHLDIVARIVAGSHCFIVAEAEGAVIGMGRAISDGVSDAYIQDVTVIPDHRRRGIGTRIVSAILDRLTADGLDWIGLIAEGGSAPLYHHLGFSPMAGGVAMRRTAGSP